MRRVQEEVSGEGDISEVGGESGERRAGEFPLLGERVRVRAPSKKFISALIIIVTIVALIGFHSYNKSYVEGESSPNLSEISRRSHVIFPQGTRVLGSYMHFQWDGYLLFAKLEMDKADVDDFIRSIPHSHWQEDSTKDRLGVTRESWRSFECYGVPKAEIAPSWWTPDSVRHYRAVIRDGNDVAVRLLLDTRQSKRTTIYLKSWHI